ncbi:hypothetical protein CANARDRAFT_26137 [[Candida] arabinofermentans NRRL YB-2248]|uniref:Uncharacterized protein n=1 Tax=[Candida] arabinofermentans NRRL YB-2248 TaxID=983967 RepID=A0A1E4T8I7_9ASCO|nr:hypothetical protein CANARDRAFT_26137 [[Candida] arabinofermentans NRRL YB-2248]
MCHGIYNDIFDNGGLYNTFFTSYRHNTSIASAFNQLYSSATSQETDQTGFQSACTELNQFLQYFSWSDRLSESAKSLYLYFQTVYITPVANTLMATNTLYYTVAYTSPVTYNLITAGGNEPSVLQSITAPSQTAIPSTTTSTSTTTTIVGTTTKTITVTSLVSTPKEFGSELRTFNNSAIITLSYGNDLILSALVQGMMIDYQKSTSEYSELINSYSNLTIIQQYTSILTKYETQDLFENSKQYVSVMQTMFDFANIIPWRSNIYDAMGWYYTEMQLYGDAELGQYTAGSGQVFNQLYNPGKQLDALSSASPTTPDVK